MLMNYSYTTNFESNDENNCFEYVSSSTKSDFSKRNTNEFRLFSDKIQIPEENNHIHRSRLCDILTKFSGQFGTTLITGRAGTGKTILAADFAKKYDRVAWFRVEAADSDWQTFSRYFIAAFKEKTLDFISELPPEETVEEDIHQFLQVLFSELELISKDKKFLIVLDDLHCVFDAVWFETFFKGMLSYQIPNVHIVMLSRTKPPFPIWRLRSKQKLSVLDEQILWFTPDELGIFLKNYNFDNHKISLIHKASYGRISKAIELSDLIQTHDTIL